MLASKINKVRTLALLLVFLGIGVMYIGFLCVVPCRFF